MDKQNETKNKLLGMPHGTASGQLRKLLLFDKVKKLGEDSCYRCGKLITKIEDFSIEHTKSWQYSDTPKETFFDLETIAFSHLSCNVAHGSRINPETGVSRFKGVPRPERQKKLENGKLWCGVGNHYAVIEDFGKDKYSKLGVKSVCKPCRRLTRRNQIAG